MRIEVESGALVQSGQELSSIGWQLGMLADALGAALGSGIASGIDPAGADFGIRYGRQAQDFAKRMADATDAHKAVGFMLQATGYNYENADAASTIGGSGPTGSVGAPPDKSSVADATGINGAMVPPPTKWALIQTFLGLAWSWPSGNASMMRITSAQWRNFANGLSAFDGEMSASKGVVAQQNIPESGKIGEALSDLAEGVHHMAEAATAMATAIDDFASGVEDTQDAIRDLMDRISLDGLWDTVTGLLTGDGDDILREVADDVRQLLENFQSQVKGIVGLLGELTNLLGSAADSFQKWVRPILVEALGDDVGNAAADYITWNTDVGVGVATGLINTVSGVVSLADLDTWKGMAEVAASVVEDPTKLPGVLANMGKQFVAWDEWSGDHPGRAAGEAAFNIGTLFVPGGALSKGGSVAKSLSYASRLFEEGRLPRIADLPGLSGASHGSSGFDGVPEARAGVPNMPEFDPSAVPDSIVSTSAPSAIDARTSPATVGSPTGPPDPPGPAGTPVAPDGQGAGTGGGGQPPDPPGRPIGTPEIGSEGVGGPSTEAPSTSEQSMPNHASSPSDPMTPAAQNVPEPASPTGTHETSRSPTDLGATSEHASIGHAWSESHRPGADGYGGKPDQHPAATADHQSPQTPAVEHPGGHERPATDGSPTREQPPDSDARGHDSSGSTLGGTAGGMPMASHTPGGTHISADGQGSSGKAPAPETSTRGTDVRGGQPGATEGPRTQPPAGAGQGPGSAAAAPVNFTTPTASVSPAAGQHISGAAAESTRVTSEPPAPRPGDSTRESPPTSHPAVHEVRGTTANRPGTQPQTPTSNTGSVRGQPPDRFGPPGNPADARAYGPHELRPVEDPAYQAAVEDALRDADGNALVHADPRTNDYRRLINDGGPSVPGRSNNCLDCSLSALSSFLGDPTVSAPRHLDRFPDGTIDDAGEHGGLRRAEAWLGSGMLEFPGGSLSEQFDAVHRYVDNLGPGSAALVHNGWHARDLATGAFLHHSDGSPVTRGSHATVVVHPDGGGGPVWWDPQHGLTSDQPPSWMTDQSTFLHFTPIDPSQGAHHGGAGDQGTGTEIFGGNVADRDIRGASVPPRMGGLEGPEPRTDGVGRGTGTDEAGDRFGDGDRVRVPELVGDDGGRGVHGVQADGHQQGGPPDLSVPVVDHGAADPGGRADHRVSADRGVADRSAGAESRTSANDSQAHIRNGSDGLAVDRGDVLRGVGEPSESGRVAGDGNDARVTDARGGQRGPELAAGDERDTGGGDGPSDTSGSGAGGARPDGVADATDPPNNPPHTGLHDPPGNHGMAGDHLPDLSGINAEFRLADGSVDPDRFDEWTRAIADAYPNIDVDGVAGVYDYTTENYQGMNPYLRDIDPLSPEQQSILGADRIDLMTDSQRTSWESRVSDTDNGLAALPPYRRDPAHMMSTTWRGMHASDDLLARLEIGGHYEDAAYLSTSLDSRVAHVFALGADPSRTPTLLTIEGLDGVDVAQMSRFADEAEVLFPRSSTFDVISRDIGDDGLVHILLRQIQP